MSDTTDTGWGMTRFTYTRAQIRKLARSYKDNLTPSRTLNAARYEMIWPEMSTFEDAVTILSFIEKIQRTANGEQNVWAPYIGDPQYPSNPEEHPEFWCKEGLVGGLDE